MQDTFIYTIITSLLHGKAILQGKVSHVLHNVFLPYIPYYCKVGAPYHEGGYQSAIQSHSLIDHNYYLSALQIPVKFSFLSNAALINTSTCNAWDKGQTF